MFTIKNEPAEEIAPHGRQISMRPLNVDSNRHVSSFLRSLVI